jgi:hypothetical protein
MLAKVTVYPEPPAADITIPFLVVVGVLALVFALVWMRHRA